MPRVKRGVTARARHKKVLDQAKGYTLLQKVKTAQGTAATPAGLAHISGYVPDYSDMKMDQLYAGICSVTFGALISLARRRLFQI